MKNKFRIIIVLMVLFVTVCCHSNRITKKQSNAINGCCYLKINDIINNQQKEKEILEWAKCLYPDKLDLKIENLKFYTLNSEKKIEFGDTIRMKISTLNLYYEWFKFINYQDSILIIDTCTRPAYKQLNYR
jgi:hypothetical protein